MIHHDDGREVGQSIPHNDGIRDVGRRFQFVFKLTGRDIFATRRDDDVFHAICDGKEALGVLSPHITGVHPAFSIKNFLGFLGQVEIARENIWTANKDFTRRRIKFHLVVRRSDTDGAKFDKAWVIG